MTERLVADQLTWLSSYAEVEEVLSSKSFLNAAPEPPDSLRWGALTDVRGSEHRQRRLAYSRLLGKSMLNQLDDVIRDAVRSELAALAPDADGNLRGDLLPLTKNSMIAVGATMCGIDGVTNHEERVQARQIAERITHASLYRWADRSSDENARLVAEVRRDFETGYFRSALERRKELVRAVKDGELESDDLPLDLITIHLTQPDRFQWEDDPESLLLREVMLFFGGAGSTVTLLTPPVVAEIATWIDNNPADRDRVTEPEFLRQACVESLRLHPSGQVLTRIANEDVVLKTGRAIAEGEVCACDAGAAARDRSVFDDDADQFRLPREYPPTSPEGLAFGGGPHLCVGLGLTLGSSGDEGSVGVMVVMLQEFYRAGMVIDDEGVELKPPVIDFDTTYPIQNYQRFTVHFENL